MTRLDSAWIAANPAPVHGSGTTKNSRGRVLAIGGAASVPGALRLTGEAALRAGAGKLQIATIASAALLLGVAVPEAGVIALPEEDGEIGDCGDRLTKPLAACDALVVGPGMGEPAAAGRLLAHVLAAVGDDTGIVIDATAIPELKGCRARAEACADRIVITPHHGEMAALTGDSADAIAADPERAALAVAREYGITVVLKADDTVIAAPDGTVLHYIGGGIGLATAGSGDVLAGAVAGLLSRGATPLVAAGWGVWLHGHGGRRVATRRGPIGFLARELPGEFPRLLPQ
ncbi:NAD(P)H-hydrate dehydratase [Sphingomonas sp.]|uniref:NAD(P)H-hydrate dehydratase n=1 Tax=Sphingomonas sp. TaxID=28214 RepID=UPI0035BC597B